MSKSSTMTTMYDRPRQASVAGTVEHIRLRQHSLPTGDTQASSFSSSNIPSRTDLPLTPSSSSNALPARKVAQKHVRSDSQVLRTGVQMPTYTILRDPPPWEMQDVDAPRAAVVPRFAVSRNNIPSSIYSYDVRQELLTSDMASLQPLNIRTPRDPDYAHPQQEITDAHPLSSRPSRLPLFKQVRSMLQRQSPQNSAPNSAKWDGHSGETGTDEKSLEVGPSKYNSSYEEPFHERARSKERTGQTSRDVSPVSVLRDEELYDQGWSRDSVTSIPISPISVSTKSLSVRRRRSLDSINVPLPPVLPSGLNQGLGQLRRKPAPPEPGVPVKARHMHIAEQYKPPTPNLTIPMTNARGLLPDARLSWNSYAQSMTSSPSASSDTSPQMGQLEFEHNEPGSRFSWTTVGTGTTWQTRPATMASSIVPPVPSINPSFGHDDILPSREYEQDSTADSSILSRSHPIKKSDRDFIAAPVAGPRRKSTPSHATTADKALPLPPELRRADSPLSHLESLLVQERDLALQHANMSRGVADIATLENASPLDVSFATVRDARKRLAEYRTRISEIELEQREVGILITRARRKEGVEEGLWVRRVTS